MNDSLSIAANTGPPAHRQPLSRALRSAALGWTAAALLWPAATPAQDRDPTRAPAAASPGAAASATTAGPATGEATDDSALKAALQHRMVIDGKPYLIERGWLRGVGDRLGEARIERITADQVWLQEGGVRRKLPLYPGIEILPSTAPSATAPAASAALPSRIRRRPRPITEMKDITR
jgi:hypothetical protein